MSYIKGCSFLMIENLIYEKQYESRSNYSTNHALISLTEFWSHRGWGLYCSGECFRYSKP